MEKIALPDAASATDAHGGIGAAMEGEIRLMKTRARKTRGEDDEMRD